MHLGSVLWSYLSQRGSSAFSVIWIISVRNCLSVTYDNNSRAELHCANHWAHHSHAQWALLGHQGLVRADAALTHGILIWPLITCSISTRFIAFVHHVLRWDEGTSSVSSPLVHSVNKRSEWLNTHLRIYPYICASSCINQTNNVKCEVERKKSPQN